MATKYQMPSNSVLSTDAAANLAHFLVANGKSVCGWTGFHMIATDQRALFGRFLGKGRIVIDGEREELRHYRKVAFGHDSDCTQTLAWRAL